MRSRDLHPLCCVSVDFRAAGDRSPASDRADAAGQAGPDVRAAGVLYKWTNFGKGWRPRWLSLRNGVLTYSKIRRADPSFPVPDDARLIGAAAGRLARIGGSPQKPIGFVYLKISSFRESKSDDRRFYIFSSTKTLRLRTDSREDRVAWIKTLVSAKLNLNEQLDFIQKDASFSTDRLQDRLRVEGLSGTLVTNCEQIMQSEFAESHEQLKLHCEERLRPSNRFQQQSEEVYVEDESRDKHDGLLPLLKHEFSISRHEYNTTASSDEVEKQEFDDISDEDEPYFFDSKESFSESTVSPDSPLRITDCADDICRSVNHSVKLEMKNDEPEANCHACPHVERRKELPEPIEKEKGVSLWSIIKDNVGKDLTRVCLPVYFNEPLSSLQKCFEDLEYSYLLDQAYEYGKMGNSLMRILNVAAFAVSGYASSAGRPCKPFNPLLGETYEADYSEKGIRFFSEKVSHHPMLIACHCEGKGWKFWGDSNLKSKFWGRSIQLDPVGVLTLEFDDGEIFQWSKVTTNIYNLILGKVYCDHHGLMNIRGNRQYSCKLKFKEQSFFDSNPHQVQGFVEDVMGAKVANIVGKWDDAMHYIMGDDLSQMKGGITTENATLLWKRSMPPANPTRYNLSSFAITLNELTPDLKVKEKLPPTDSRLRPDQRHLENGEYGKANAEKLRLEKRQRMSSKLQEDGWKPRWFERDTETGTFQYIGGYWEAREQKKWDECLHIFGELSDDLNVTPCE